LPRLRTTIAWGFSQSWGEMPRAKRQACRAFQGLKYREAADALAIAIGTLRSRIHDAVLVLRGTWHQDGESHGKALSVS
jgi:DNA-directed RNA polymerase specialized sigma24 family protein